MMDVFEAISTRRSIRKYLQEPIPDDRLEMIFEAVHLAPSPSNRQPWRFIVVRGANRKKTLARAANNQTFLSDADAIVAAIGNPDVSARWHERDPMIALEHMALAAAALGQGTCWSARQIVWISPVDAVSLEIKSGEDVTLFNELGAATIEAVVTENVSKGVLCRQDLGPGRTVFH